MLRAQISKSSVSLRRSIATAHSKTEYTSLSNGITVATESNSAAKTATLGLWVGAGSTSENPWNNGVSNLLNHVIVHGNRSEAYSKGLTFGASTDRDFSAYYTQGLKSSLPKAIEFLNKEVATLNINAADFKNQRAFVTNQIEEFETTNHAGRVLEHLHASAFQNTPLALPTRGTVETVCDLVEEDLIDFHSKNFVASNTVVVASGDVVHDEIVELVEKSLKVPTGEAPAIKKPQFLGSEIRLRDDTLPNAWIAIAHQGEALNSPNYYVAKVAAQIFGDYNYHEPSAKTISVKLASITNEFHIADTFSHFSKSYKDAGLFGFQAEISNTHQIDDFVHFALKEYNRLSISITDTEVARGKQLLKNKILFDLSSPFAIANDIGAKVIGQGRRPSSDEIFAKIDKVDAAAIKAWASDRLWDQDVVISGTGQIESLLDYARIRNETAMMRW